MSIQVLAQTPHIPRPMQSYAISNMLSSLFFFFFNTGIKISYSSFLSLLMQPGQRRTEQQALLASEPRATMTTAGTW